MGENNLANPEELSINIDEIPKDFGDLAKLKKLYISGSQHNQKTIPVELGKFVNLKELTICCNTLPSSIGNLSALEKLEIEGEISELPGSFYSLKNLNYLKVRFTKIKSIDKDIKNLLKLEILLLLDNENLEELPDSIGDLENLKVFYLSSNAGLKKLPESAGNLKSLEDLEFIYGAFTRLPESFINLSSLKKIRLAWNEHLENFPFTKSQIYNLRTLDLQDNPVINLPDWLINVDSKIMSSGTKEIVRKNKSSKEVSPKSLADELLKELDETSLDYLFPYWDDYSTYHTVTGLMRVSGYKSEDGALLVFEVIEYIMGIGCIINRLLGMGTFAIPARPKDEMLLHIDLMDFTLPEEGMQFKFNFKNRSYEIPLSQEFIADCKTYRNAEDELPQDRAVLLFKICETVPRDQLFAEEEEIKEIYKLSGSAKKIFSVDNWRHPTNEELFLDDLKPSEFESLQEMVKAVCEERMPQLKEEPNTDWRKMWIKE